MLFDLIPEWIIGVCLGIIGTSTSNLGWNVQKLSHRVAGTENNNEDGVSESSDQKYFLNSLWVIGFSIFAIGEAFTGVAMGYTSHSLLAVIAVFGMVTNGIFAHLLLQERITKRYVRACAIIMVGCIVVVFSASHKDQNYSLRDITRLFSSLVFINFFLLGLLCLAVLHYVRKFANNYLINTLLAAGCSCFGTLFAKCTVQIVKSSFLSRTNQLINPAAWLIIAAFAFFAACNVHCLNRALIQAPSTKVLPLYFAASTVLVVICGMLFFKEYKLFSVAQFLCFIAGIGITLYGTNSLSKKRRRTKKIIIDDIDDDSATESIPILDA